MESGVQFIIMMQVLMKMLELSVDNLDTTRMVSY